MARKQTTDCYCGRGCSGKPGTDGRVRSERDAIAKYLDLWGPMPVYAGGGPNNGGRVIAYIVNVDGLRVSTSKMADMLL